LIGEAPQTLAMRQTSPDGAALQAKREQVKDLIKRRLRTTPAHHASMEKA
jgi:hypothetical protein